MDYSNLSSKTVFDFTSDLELLGGIVGSYHLGSKEDVDNFIRFEKSNQDSNALHLLILAEELGDDIFISAVHSQMGDIINGIFNE